MGGKRILVVDDDKTLTALVRKMLTGQGFEVTVAASGLDAVTHATGGGFDLVLMDMNMANWDGKTAATFMEQMLPELKIILVTGNSDDKLLREMRALPNIVDIVPKPFKVEQLIQTVQQRLQ